MPLRLSLAIAIAAASGAMVASLAASASGQPAPAEATATPGGDLLEVEARLAERYDRLELSIARLAELSGSTQPRRSALLRQLVAQSRDRDVAGQFDKVIAALDQNSYSSAIEGQTALEGELQSLLELLLQEDRDRQIESEKKRIARFLQDVNKLIRLQRGVTARTDGGDDEKALADDQQEVSEKTGKLGKELAESTETNEAKARRTEQQLKGATEKPGESAGDPSKSGDSAEQGDNSESGKPNGAQAPPGERAEGEPSKGSPSKGDGASGQPGQSQQQPEESPPPPAARAAERLRQAQQRMDEARKQLEEAERQGAVKDQQAAVEELEQAKAELERILRQLREEELERMLVMIEARLRKMLDEQIEIYDQTKHLDGAHAQAAEHEVEIAGGRLARREDAIVREADRALVLLREDGTSIAFPEAIEQARDDMRSVASRLREAKVEKVTQQLEQDVIAALEESLAAMQQALKELRQQKGQPPQQGGGQPGEKPLVDQLAELRMIRSLQDRVNRRTKLFGDMIDGEQATEGELVESLRELAVRQQKIFQATHDLETQED